MQKMNRREFVKAMVSGGAVVGLGGILACSGGSSDNAQPEAAYSSTGSEITDVVSVVKIEEGDIDYAVREAIDLLGGIRTITLGKEKIMLKPNLVSPASSDTTNPDVIFALAQLMQEAGKDVCIGEGSAGSTPNIINGEVCRTTDIETLNAIQQSVFDILSYSDLAHRLDIPLINLHVGEMVSRTMDDGFVFDEISLHQSLTEIDLLCSVPMMKTHGLATVTLGMKNLIGLYPGQIYGTVRSAVHQQAAMVEPSGTASAIIDMVRANRLGLVVIDGSTAMEGQGPSSRGGGTLIQMDLIIAGTNPLATDMVAADIMGFSPEEISTFEWAWRAGMTPANLSSIEVRGAAPDSVRRRFLRPTVFPYPDTYGPPC